MKRNIVLFEEEKLGRLFDADVLDQEDGLAQTRGRVEFGYESRRRLVCDQDARIYTSRRLHPVPMLQQRLIQLLAENVRELERNGSTQ